MKKYIILAILSGLLLGLSWPTYGFALLLFIGFVPLLLIEYDFRKKDIKKSGLKLFGLTFLTFLIFNAITTWWLWYATAFGMFFAFFENALLMTLVFFIYHKVALKTKENLALLFLVVFWISFEKFHLSWDFSWTWLNLGNGFSFYHKWVQWYAYTGVFGGTLWIWIVNIGFYISLRNYFKNKDAKLLLKGFLLNTSVIVLGIFISLYIYHTYKSKNIGKVNVIVVQPNVDPYSEKYNITNKETAINLINQVKNNIDSTTNFIIAPETTFSQPILQKHYSQTSAYKILKAFTDKHKNTAIIAGYTFYKQYQSFKRPTISANKFSNANGWYDMYNAAAMIEFNKKPQIYYKSKLVAGVELFPYKSILEPIFGNSLINLGGAVASLGTQKYRSVFKTNNYKVAPIICYESVYGNFVNGFVKKGANFLAVITNDGWWHNSQGHKQHLMFSKLRAIENRRSLARAANTGTSAIINQRGDIIKRLNYNKKGVIKATIKLNDKLTFYNKYGDYIARISQFLSVLLLLITFFTKKKKSLITS